MVKGEGAPNEGGYEQVFVLRLLMKNIQAIESSWCVDGGGSLPCAGILVTPEAFWACWAQNNAFRGHKSQCSALLRLL